MIFENTYSATRRVGDNLLRENITMRMQIPSTCHNPIHGRLINSCDEYWYDL